MTTDGAVWAAENSAALVGLPAAAAQQEAVGAGLRPRIVAPGVMITLERRSERVTLHTDESGIVTKVTSG